MCEKRDDKMKKVKRIISLLLAAGMALSLCCMAAQTQEEPVTLFDEAWVYPVQPGTPEWQKMSIQQRLESCQIPEDIIKGMSTDALLETVLHCPDIVDIVAYSTLKLGMERTSLKIPALKELLDRSDVRLAMHRYESENKAAKSTVRSEILLTGCLHLIRRYLDMAELEAQVQAAGQPSVCSPAWTEAYVYTPMGIAVYAKKNLSWSHHEITLSYANAVCEYYLRRYQSAELLSGPSPKYNGHSYA